MAEEVNESPARVLVTPGEVIATDPKLLPGRGAIKDGDNIISVFIGLMNTRGKYVNVVPLNGLYDPKVGDKIIGVVVDKTPTKWLIDINGKSLALLSPKDAVKKAEEGNFKPIKVGTYVISKPDKLDMYSVGDVLICKMISGMRTDTPRLTTLGHKLGKIKNGVIMQISPPKIPRVIGRRASMVSVLKRELDCKIFIAQNGRIWVQGQSIHHEDLLIEIIKKIESEAHTTGLTNRITYTIVNEKKERGIE